MFFRIHQLETHHPEQVSEYSDYIGDLLRKFCKSHIHKFNRRELGLLLSYTRKYSKEVPAEVFINAANYTLGLLQSDLYNDKSCLDEEFEEERLTTYFSEIAHIHRHLVKKNERADETIQRNFREISAGLANHVGKFRNPNNFFRVATALAQVVNLPAPFAARAAAEFKPSKSAFATSNYLLVTRTQSASGLKEQYSHVFNYLLKSGVVSRIHFLQDFIDTFNVAADNSAFKKEASELVARADNEAEELSFRCLISFAETAHVQTGTVPHGIAKFLEVRTGETASHLGKQDFYRYFRTYQFTKTLSPQIVKTYLDRKRETGTALEFSPEQTEHLLKMLEGADMDPSLLINELKSEFEADFAVQSKPYTSVTKWKS